MTRPLPFMRIDLVFPALPPALDGIGDHTTHLANGLSDHCDVRILTAQSDATPIPGVQIAPVFSIDRPWGVHGIVDAVAEDPPDWLVLQFNQFSYGRWGFNPFLPHALKRIRRAAPETRIAWIAHEDFVPATSLKFALMRLWQRWQFQALGGLADQIFFSIAPWVDTYSPWFDGTPVHHLPIGSNMPYVDEDSSELRSILGLDAPFVVGLFGTLRARLLDNVAAALTALQRHATDVVLLYIGPDGPALRETLPDLPLLDAGRLPADAVSRHLPLMDLHLTPFIDGVSTRRGSFMAGLQHGVPTLATEGELTDRLLRRLDGHAFMLSPRNDADAFARAALTLHDNPEYRQRLGRNGKRLYNDRFSFDVTVPAFLDILADAPTSFSTPASAPLPLP